MLKLSILPRIRKSIIPESPRTNLPEYTVPSLSMIWSAQAVAGKRPTNMQAKDI
jgi:hypothetical protein